ncbi:Mercuric ion reductase [Citrifermentans bremense]|uniref:Mercuric ion reductase n=1 Tax=Citrifermentans bremense TaxID=60035 RepID=A0A6S6M264_9BACT|nr:mercuric reductase [Citrifermentans bremense]BCG45704.1 Mercuric ion reductase [Citrifermentans bremense]
MSENILFQPDSAENRELEWNVRPPGWQNPVPSGRYNLVVVGAGTAGLVCAAGAAALGARVALVERLALGGDCLNVGCVPSKALLRASRAVFDARGIGGFGVVGGERLQADFSVALKRMRGLRAGISSHDSALRFRDQLGVDVYLGQGTFTAADALHVDGATLRFAKAALCTGARAAIPPVPGLEELGCLTNETVFSLTSLPQRFAVIGSGPVGCELAQAFARFGSKVTLIERGAGILAREDRDAAAILETAFRREGIQLELRAKLVRAWSSGSEKRLLLERDGAEFEVAVDAVLVGAGRAPNTDGLGLEAAGVEFDGSGVKVNDFLQTSNRRIYAAGDICSAYKFTHVADAQARVVIENALFPGRRKNSALTVPWCTYTDPEVAHVGIYEADAAAHGVEVRTLTIPFAEVDRAVLDGETEGFARVHLKKGSDTILGATIVARHAGEMIVEVVLAIGAGLGLSAIGRTIHPYPTQAESLRKLADSYNRGRLTPSVKKLMTAWLAWQRKW